MKIPQEHDAFEKPTLIAATDSVHAKLYLANGHDIDALDVVESHYPPKDDMERTSGMGGGAHFAEESENLKEVSREKLYAALSEDLMHRLQRGEFEALAICAPEEHLAELKETLHVNLLKRVVAEVPKLLTNETPIDLVAHVKHAMFPAA